MSRQPVISSLSFRLEPATQRLPSSRTAPSSVSLPKNERMTTLVVPASFRGTGSSVKPSGKPGEGERPQTTYPAS